MKTMHTVMLALVVLLAGLAGCEGCIRTIRRPLPEDSGPPAYNLGLMPAEQRLRWPFRPETEHEATLTSPNDLDGSWTQSRARLTVRGQLDQLVIDADDVAIVGERGSFVQTLVVVAGRQRIHVDGGLYGQIVLEQPRSLRPPPPAWRVDDMIEDVLIENVHVMAVSTGLSGVLIRGRRVAFVNSRVEAQFMAVFVGDTAPVQSEDVVIAGCRLTSAGEDVAVVLSDVRRGAVVENRIENPSTSTLRMHGQSEWLVASTNTLIGGGVMIATDPRDEMEHVWFVGHELYQTTPHMVSLHPDRIRHLVLAANTFYSPTATCVWCGHTPEHWLLNGNRILRYRDPPTP